MKKSTMLPLNEIHILEKCCLIEERCAHIYRHFGRQFSEEPDISALWHKVATEEDHHADQFRLATCHLGAKIKDIDFTDKKLKAILSKLDSIHSTIETSRPSLSEAFEIALYIEKSLAEYHIDSILTYADHGLSELFIKMEKNDQGHLELLQNAIESLR
jgi:rubrerythrin